MNISLKHSILSSAIAMAMMSPQVFASNGMAPTGLGQTHKAMGGAATGNPMNTMSMASNPAAGSFVADGWDVGIEYFKPNRSAEISGSPFGMLDGNFDGNEDKAFWIPEGGYKKTIGDYSIGVVAYGNGGMNTNYANNPFAPMGATGNAGVDFAQLFISPTLSKKIGENQSVGISANLIYQRFKAQGIQPFAGFSSDPANLTNKDYDSATGIGVTLGWQAQASDDVIVGIAYKSKGKMSEFENYKGLFPDSGKFDVPASFSMGMSWKATPKTTVAADVSRIFYSDVATTGNPKPLTPGSLGSADGPGFGWDDQDVIKVGVRHEVNSKLALMGGANYGKQPVPADRTLLNMLAPGITDKHVSLGAEWKLNDKSSIIGSYVRTFNKKLEGEHSLAGIGMPGDADLEMDQHAFGIGYSRKF